ncbi:MAG: hypothetical protein A2X49_16755 [Lentisphaerae bacterium GWF2_52_8]|nr:MAG: hypothetical protein A2X49_16755 [Lentisphaerae bacterium GWF2_52_8]
MADVYAESSSQSWLQRIGNSVKLTFFGVILLATASSLLWFNEGFAINNTKILRFVKTNANPLSKPNFNPENNQKLVYLRGETIGGKIADELIFPINAILLHREVLMFQWTENRNTHAETKLGGSETTTTHYSYQKEWCDKLKDSSSFRHPEGHNNPKAFHISTCTIIAPTVKIGDFTVLNEIISKLGFFAFRDKPQIKPGLALPLKQGDSPNSFFCGTDPAIPAVGDLKISYFYVPSKSTTSILACQNEDRTLGSFQTPYGDFSKIMNGQVSLEGMITDQANSNSFITWIFRTIGFILMLIGFMLLLKLFVVLGDFIPVLGKLVGRGVFLLSLLLCIVCSLVVITSSWLYHLGFL